MSVLASEFSATEFSLIHSFFFISTGYWLIQLNYLKLIMDTGLQKALFI